MSLSGWQRHGQVTPDAWLIHATGAPLAADALQATAEAQPCSGIARGYIVGMQEVQAG